MTDAPEHPCPWCGGEQYRSHCYAARCTWWRCTGCQAVVGPQARFIPGRLKKNS